MSGDGSYAPKSPDLSSFYSAGPTPPAEPAEVPRQQELLSQSSHSNFSHLQQSASSTYSPAGAYYQQQAHAPQQEDRQHYGYKYQLATPPQTLSQARSTNSYPHSSQAPPPAGFGVGEGYSPTAQHKDCLPRAQSHPGPGHAQPGTRYADTQAPPHPPQSAAYQPPYRGSFQYQYQQTQTAHPQIPAPTFHPLTAAQAQVRESYEYPIPSAPPPSQQPESTMPPRRAAAAAAAAALASQAAGSEASTDASAGLSSSSSTITAAAAAGATTTIEPGPVKTKFPTARIKRIMQADEEVGKVAQQTPIAVGKALELFMVALVTRSAELARQRNSKRVSAQMLRQVVEADEQWDFLTDIVAKVENEEKSGKGGGGGSSSNKVKAESDSDEDGAGDGVSGGASGGKRKRGAGGGRKKKV
ncbi:uncharacterized protein THITE_2118919 [Thermothielavioides terrestris NRRL 8126]|uniref:Transcription factor CBF/NF-Y/archaeal histone domain-containing protein n=1 Tax=Thermothielavioides terrestris (strain ATCC 38088 / NRRL 8126) TaxID=578455 RepID=G2RB26_THETT|nr:uncharacterized protein THITE_2118919 [Thermothielavioides terrestris NRRL 8126]AEO68997.1 hypothetical protein THITE_2118919 [Thermothielavioides terrestris NRRL 8126]